MTLVRVTIDVAKPEGRKIETEFYSVERETEKKLTFRKAEWSGGRFREKKESWFKSELGRVRKTRGGSDWRRTICFCTKEDDIREIRKSEEMTMAVMAIVWSLRNEMHGVAVELERIAGEGDENER